MTEFQIRKGELTVNGSKKQARKVLKRFAKRYKGVSVAVTTCRSLR